MSQVQPCEFDLLRVIEIEFLNQPIVKRSMILEFQRTDRMSNPFERIAVTVREIVKRIDAPLVSGPMMFGMSDTIEQGVSHIHISVSQIDFGSENVGTVGEFTRAHSPKQIEIFSDGSIAIRTRFTWLSQRAA